MSVPSADDRESAHTEQALAAPGPPAAAAWLVRGGRWKSTFVKLEVRGAVLVTAGGRLGGKRGWVTASPADTPGKALQALRDMVAYYRREEGYDQLDEEPEGWPPLPATIFLGPPEVSEDSSD